LLTCLESLFGCASAPVEKKIRPGARNVWPDLLAKLKEVGISHYSIFRREQDLVLVMQVDDFDAAWQELDRDPTNLRWQQKMSELFEPVPDLQPNEKFAMFKEVFYLE
jgi:L-rhamnose mutarotase